MRLEEKAKLHATFCSGLGANVFAVGVATPIISAFQSSTALTLATLQWPLAIAGVCTLVAVILHMIGQACLNALRK